MLQAPHESQLALDGQADLLFAPYADMALLDCVLAAENMGVYASTGPNFSYALFGRDSIAVGEKIYKHDRLLAQRIILGLATQQGTANNPEDNEEIGKIHHEFRSATFGGIEVPQDCVTRMHDLLKERGRPTGETMRTYESADATPLFIRFVKKFTDEYGDDFLDQSFINKDGVPSTIRESVGLATNWLTNKLLERDDRLLWYKRTNPGSIENQVWKDSRTSHMFSDGTLPDFEHQVVSTELQGYSYDALKAAAHFFPEHADGYNALADEVQRSTLEKLWMPEEQFFAQGLATHQSGEERQLDTLASEGGLLLDSQMLKDLPDWARDMYVNGVVDKIMGAEFLTSVGIRCRAVRHANLLPYVDYHGSYAVWTKETSEIARGLENFGKIAEAQILHKAILDSPRTTGEFFELTYVDLDGTVYYWPQEGVARFSSKDKGEPLPVPEKDQAWTRAAAILSAFILLAALKLMTTEQQRPDAEPGI